jgi:hypothetical protein
MPPFEAVTKHSVSGVPGPTVGTLRVAVGKGVDKVETSKVGSGVRELGKLEKSKVGRAASVAPGVRAIVGKGTHVGS